MFCFVFFVRIQINRQSGSKPNKPGFYLISHRYGPMWREKPREKQNPIDKNFKSRDNFLTLNGTSKISEVCFLFLLCLYSRAVIPNRSQWNEIKLNNPWNEKVPILTLFFCFDYFLFFQTRFISKHTPHTKPQWIMSNERIDFNVSFFFFCCHYFSFDLAKSWIYFSETHLLS